jgi:putative glycosyltransferase (TIGR04372 family)
VRSYLLHAGSRKLRVTEVNPRQYGHLALEIVMSFALARQEASSVYFLVPAPAVSEALLQVEADGIRTLRRSRVRDLAARAAWAGAEAAVDTTRWCSYQRFLVGYEFRREIVEHLRVAPLEREPRRALQALVDSLPRGPRRARRPESEVSRLYYRRRLLRAPVPVRLPSHLQPAILAAAERVGLDLEKPLVTVHVREAGYKRGREMHQAKPGGRNDATRNARIESYFAAMDRLVGRGYTVVRIGDPSMTPVSRPGVVDLATSPHRSQLLEIASMLRARFFLSGEAGPVGVAYLTNTPLLTVNATDPISSYPIRRDGMLLMKHVVARASGRELPVEELVSEAHLRHLRDLLHYDYRDNTSEEIVAAVDEMLACLDGDDAETATQREFRALATEAGTQLATTLQYVRKWGSDDGFLGDGRIVTGAAA